MWVLILAFYAGAVSDDDSISMITQIYQTEQTCEAAGKAAHDKFETFYKPVKYVCTKQ